jgi:hypothetical protein
MGLRKTPMGSVSIELPLKMIRDLNMVAKEHTALRQTVSNMDDEIEMAVRKYLFDMGFPDYSPRFREDR